MMTTEEKAKRYDLAIETAKCIYNNMKEGGNFGGMEDLEEIFPELKESEDEESKKWILEYLHDGLRKSDKQFKGQFEAAIAWLEKQGKNNMGISEATKQVLEDNLNKALEKETPESCNEFLEKQGEQKLTENKDYSAPFDIEIPFGAKDSELIQETIRIPDGCYASIEGNEIVIKKGQKSAEWSEEGEMIYQHCKTILHDYGYDNWLKSLKEKYIWKPTDLQIEALESATENCAYSEYQDCLRDLIKQLKQLS